MLNNLVKNLFNIRLRISCTCTWILLTLRLWYPTKFGNNSLQLSWYFKTKGSLFPAYLARSECKHHVTRNAASLRVSDTSFDKLGLIRALVQNYNKQHITNQISYNLQTFITEYYSAGWNLLKYSFWISEDSRPPYAPHRTQTKLVEMKQSILYSHFNA